MTFRFSPGNRINVQITMPNEVIIETLLFTKVSVVPLKFKIDLGELKLAVLLGTSTTTAVTNKSGLQVSFDIILVFLGTAMQNHDWLRS